MKARIAVLAGDGIGPEVTAEGVRCLERVATLFGHELELVPAAFGGAAIDECGTPLPEATLKTCLAADAVLLGAIGGPRWSAPERQARPEAGLLRLRKELGAFANLRPVRVHPALADASSLKAEVVRGVDLVFARGRRRRLTSIDKSNVLETSRLWRAVTQRVVSEEFPEIALDHLLVDAAAMHLIRTPRDFDVLVTENMFGDILTDEASMLAGSLGLLPSASLGHGRRGIYEPIHGSAPDIAGRGMANPLGMILSVALLLRHSLGLAAEAVALEQAVESALTAGARTPDLVAGGESPLSTRAMGDTVLSRLRQPA